MAKKASNKGKATHKNMTKVIATIKADNKDSYIFKETMVLAEKINETLAQYTQ